jgi:hypothetical protein
LDADKLAGGKNNMVEHLLETVPQNPETILSKPPTRCVIVVDQDLPAGRLANAVAVIALTIGQRHPILVGDSLVDGSGFAHPGLIPIGITILAAAQSELPEIRQKGLETSCDVIDFPVEGQQTKNYQIFCETVAALQPEAMKYTGVALVGQKKEINKIVGKLALLN